MVSAVGWTVTRTVEWGLGLLEWTADEEMTPRHFAMMVTTVTVLVVPPVIGLIWLWKSLAPVYKEALTEMGKLALAVPKWMWGRVSAAARWTACRLTAKARASRTRMEQAVTTRTSARSSVTAIATSGRSTQLLTSDADDTTANASMGCFAPNIQQVVVQKTIRDTSLVHSCTKWLQWCTTSAYAHGHSMPIQCHLACTTSTRVEPLKAITVAADTQIQCRARKKTRENGRRNIEARR